MRLRSDAFSGIAGNITTSCYVIDTDILTANFKTIEEIPVLVAEGKADIMASVAFVYLENKWKLKLEKRF